MCMYIIISLYFLCLIQLENQYQNIALSLYKLFFPSSWSFLAHHGGRTWQRGGHDQRLGHLAYRLGVQVPTVPQTRFGSDDCDTI